MKAAWIIAGLVVLGGCARQPEPTKPSAAATLDALCPFPSGPNGDYLKCRWAHVDLLVAGIKEEGESDRGIGIDALERKWARDDYNKAVSRLPLRYQLGPMF